MVPVPPKSRNVGNPVGFYATPSRHGSGMHSFSYQLDDVTLFAKVFFPKIQMADILLGCGHYSGDTLELYFDNCTIRVEILDITDEGVFGHISGCTKA